jgi:TPR repeat protein
MRYLLLIGLAALTLARPSWAALDDGLAAYDSGDYLAAYRELRPLADAGDPAAQHALARMFFAGQGMPRDAVAAMGWERKAADLGETAAQLDLATRYENGIDVPTDMEQAARWYGMAAEHGAPVAQYRLALLYLNGVGIAQDLVTAHMWLNLAAAKLPPGEVRNAVANARDAVGAKMSVTQIRQAQERARDWKPKGGIP